MTLVMNCLRGALAGLILVAAGASAEAETPGPVIEGNVIEGVRNARYCEIIPIVRDGVHLVATAYSTLGLNDCPADVWAAITEDSLKKRFGAIMVLLNGPRYFLMDSITAKDATKAGERIEAGGLALTERASIDLGLFDLLHRSYRETTIDRDTLYLFKAGSRPAEAAFGLALHDDGPGKGSRRRRGRKGDRRAGRSREHLSEA